MRGMQCHHACCSTWKSLRKNGLHHACDCILHVAVLGRHRACHESAVTAVPSENAAVTFDLRADLRTVCGGTRHAGQVARCFLAYIACAACNLAGYKHSVTACVGMDPKS